MFFITLIYLLSFLSYILWIFYCNSKKNKTPKENSTDIASNRLLYPLALTFYHKHKKICSYNNNSMEYIPDITQLAEYINYQNNYQSVTTPLTVIGILEDIDLTKNTERLIVELNSLCSKKAWCLAKIVEKSRTAPIYNLCSKIFILIYEFKSSYFLLLKYKMLLIRY